MVAITGTLKNANNELLAGELWVQLDGALKDASTTPDSTLLPILRKLTITNGAVSLNLPESETQQVSYWFRFFEYETNTTTPKVLPAIEFRAFVPNTASIEFDDLIPVNISLDTIGINAAQIAQILANNAQFAEILRGDPRFVGDYSATRIYKRGEAAKFAGSWWMWKVNSQLSGIEPSEVLPASDYWIKISEKGDPGGTGGQDTAYGPGWNGALWAPSANAIYDIISTLATIASLANYAPLNNAVLTGNPGRDTALAANSNSNLFATSAWVRSLFALLDSPLFTGTPAAPTQALSDNSGKLATTNFVWGAIQSRAIGSLVVASQQVGFALTSGVQTVIPWATEEYDPGGLFASGVFTPTATGFYEVVIQGRWTATGSNPTLVRTFFGGVQIYELSNPAAAVVSPSFLAHGLLQLTQGVPYDTQILVTGTSPFFGSQSRIAIRRLNP
jgi:hypothetical protein